MEAGVVVLVVGELSALPPLPVSWLQAANVPLTATEPAAPPRSCRKRRRLTASSVSVGATSIFSLGGNASVISGPFLNCLNSWLTHTFNLFCQTPCFRVRL